LSRKLSRYLSLPLAFLITSLIGCTQADVVKRITPPKDEARAKNFVELLRRGNFDQIEDDLSPNLVNARTRGTLAQMAAMFPDKEPLSVKLVGVTVFRTEDGHSSDITLEYEFPGRWVLVEVATVQKGELLTTSSFHVNPIPDSLESLNKFKLAGKGSTQYLTLFLAAIDLAVSLFAFIVCLKKRVERKWFWLIASVFGIGRLGVNWTTGSSAFNLLWVQIPTAQASAQFYGPWIISLSFPLGAIVFLVLRNQLGGPKPAPATEL
jgi:hypothetical protein